MLPFAQSIRLPRNAEVSFMATTHVALESDAASAPGAGACTAPRAERPRTGRVLVIDDEWCVRDILATMLALDGHRVECASGGEEGLEFLARDDFDLVITDLNMPGMDGVQVLERMRQLESSALGIVVTGVGAVDAAVRAIRSGAYDYVTKPFHMEEIRFLVRRALDYRSLREENRELRRLLRERAEVPEAGERDAGDERGEDGSDPPEIDFSELVDRFERDLILRALERTGGVKNRAARLLGLKRTTLLEKMKKKGMLALDAR